MHDLPDPFVIGSQEPDLLRQSLQALYTMLLSDETLEQTLRRVAELAATAIAPCDLADITLVRDGRPVSKGATDERLRHLDGVQYGASRGPCVEALRTNQVVQVGSVRTDERWPEYGVAAGDAGIGSAVAVPLEVRGVVIGALNLFSAADHAFSDGDVELARLFAAQAAVALANAQTHAASLELARQLNDALASRATIEQAKGILMAEHHCSPERAFELLVERSQHENRKLRVVAADLVAAADGDETTRRVAN